jgi:hypothetical protein
MKKRYASLGGIHYSETEDRYIGRITVNGKRKYIKSSKDFSVVKEAMKPYNIKSKTNGREELKPDFNYILNAASGGGVA